MTNFGLVLLNTAISCLFLSCALLLASLKEIENGPKGLAIPIAIFTAAMGIVKFFLYSYPVSSICPENFTLYFILLISFVAIFMLYLASKGLQAPLRLALLLLAVAISLEPVLLALSFNPFILLIQAGLLVLANTLLIKRMFGLKEVTTFYAEGLFFFAIIMALTMILFINLESQQTKTILSKAYELIRTYQQVLANAEKRGFSDAKLLALSVNGPAPFETFGKRRLFVWSKMLRGRTISFLNREGVVISSSTPELQHADLSYINCVTKALSGQTASHIQKGLTGNEVPVLLISRPAISRKYEVTGAVLLETDLEEILGDGFKRNGLFFLNERNEIIFGNGKGQTGKSPGLFLKNFFKNHAKPDGGQSFCIHDTEKEIQQTFCYNGQLYKLVSLPLYGHNIRISKVFSLQQILYYRFNLALAIFLMGTIYILVLHKFLKGRIYSIRLQEEIKNRKKAEEKLRTLAAVVEQAVESIIITDPQGTVLYVNPFFTRLTGFQPEEIIGKKADFAKGLEETPDANKKIWKNILKGKPWSGRLSSKAKNGKELLEECIIFPIKDKKGVIEGIVEVKKDVTRERELESLLLHSQKMESVGMLAGGVAHDFNNILAALQINLDLISLYNFDPQKTKHYIEKIQYGVSRASDLVKQLLLFSRRQLLEREVVDLNQAISNLLQMMESTLGENIRLKIEKAPDLWPIIADPGVVDQIIMNLVVNAKDAMPNGGTLFISTKNEILDGKDGHKEFVKLSVTDTGHGMSQEILDHIFDPFFTTKDIGKGTGLGLSVVYGIVKQHGGFIDVKSQKGKGTTFNVFFVAAPDKAKALSGEDQDPASGHKGKGERILLVEDEAAVRTVIQEALIENNYEVVSSKTIEEAWKAYLDKGPFHLLIADIVLPDGSGFELAEELERVDPDLAILLMSGYADKRVKEDEIRKKGYAFFQKPFKVSRLLKAISSLLSDKNQTRN